MQNQSPAERPTIRAHKRQFAWQILVPFLVMAGLVVAGSVLVVTGGETQNRVWADISMIWLIAPALLFALALLVLLVTIIYGMVKLLQIIPVYSGKAQGVFTLLSAGARKLADGVAQPFVWLRQAGAVISSIFKR
jgi:hypothetical protein